MLNDHLIIIMVLTYANFSLCLGVEALRALHRSLMPGSVCLRKRERACMKENREMEQERENVTEDKFLCLTVLAQAPLIWCFAITALSIKQILRESDPFVHSHLKLS